MKKLALPGGVVATLQTLAANLAILVLNFGTGIITARFLGPTGRGELAAIITWPQFLAYALTLGLPASLLYHLKRFPERGSELFSAVLVLSALMGVVATATGVVLIPSWLAQYPADVVQFAQAVMIVAPLALLSVSLIGALLAREEFGIYNWVRILHPIGSLVLVAALAAAGRLTARSAALAVLLGGMPIFLWVFGRLWRSYRPKLHGIVWASRRLTSYGSRAYGADLLGTVAGQVDRVLLIGLVHPALMGLYVVASSFSQTMNVVPTAVASIASAKCPGRPVTEVVAIIGRGARASLGATLVLAIGAGVLSPYILGFVYGPDFVAAIWVLRILLLEAVLRGAVTVFSSAFMALGRPGLVTLLQGLGLCVGAPALLLLVPPYGLEGAGVAVLIATAVRLASVLALFPMALGCSPPRPWPTWSDLSDLIAVLQRAQAAPVQIAASVKD